MCRETNIVYNTCSTLYARSSDDISSGKDPEKLNTDLEDAIRQVCYLKEHAIISAMSAYQNRQESHYTHAPYDI